MRKPPILSFTKETSFKEIKNDERSDVDANDANDAEHDGHADNDATVDDGSWYDADDAKSNDAESNDAKHDDAQHDEHAVDDADDDGKNEVHHDGDRYDLRNDAHGRVVKSHVHGVL